MENNSLSHGRAPAASVQHLATFPIFVARLGGRPVALCERHVAVLSLVGLPGTVRWVGADRVIGVHLDHDPLDQVTEYHRDYLRVTWGGTTLHVLEAYLATRPPVAADFDAHEAP